MKTTRIWRTCHCPFETHKAPWVFRHPPGIKCPNPPYRSARQLGEMDLVFIQHHQA